MRRCRLALGHVAGQIPGVDQEKEAELRDEQEAEETHMTREQAMKFLPSMFRKSALGGGNGSTLTAMSVFINWLYKNHFEIISRKERASLQTQPNYQHQLGPEP